LPQWIVRGHLKTVAQLIGARRGSPLAIGYGHDEMYFGSDAIALAPFTDTISYLEDGDSAVLTRNSVEVHDAKGSKVERAVLKSSASAFLVDKGNYRHFMAKEIHEQPEVVGHTFAHYLDMAAERVRLPADLPFDFRAIERLAIAACGTSYYAGLVAKYWFERFARLPVEIDVASEFRYREAPFSPGNLALFVSQSGETADTLAAVKVAKARGARAYTICNVVGSAISRECDGGTLLTRAGPEIGVASTKAFTTQLAALFVLTLVFAKVRRRLSPARERELIAQLRHLPAAMEAVLSVEPKVQGWARRFQAKQHALFLGRGVHFPIAMEGALKLKEISYVHAEAYAAGELKHGPLALVDSEMPVVTVAPNDQLLEKLKSNMQEVRARGGELYVVADRDAQVAESEGVHVIRLVDHAGPLSPILHVIPLQLLAYHVALLRGTDVDKPRNLAKSVTVE
jgi:glucosamine--fructose-6-phosphate aminotransferase (isomerizing)